MKHRGIDILIWSTYCKLFKKIFHAINFNYWFFQSLVFLFFKVSINGCELAENGGKPRLISKEMRTKRLGDTHNVMMGFFEIYYKPSAELALSITSTIYLIRSTSKALLVPVYENNSSCLLCLQRKKPTRWLRIE